MDRSQRVRGHHPPSFPSSQVIALPPVDMVTSGQVLTSDIRPNSDKVDIWALGVTLYELITGAPSAPLPQRPRKPAAHLVPLHLVCP